jgi:hypothetical protein
LTGPCAELTDVTGLPLQLLNSATRSLTASAILDTERFLNSEKDLYIMAHKRTSSLSRFADSWLYGAMPFKIRLSYLSRLSDRYLGELQVTVQEPPEDSVVGYESSWPDNDKGVKS